MSLSSVSDPESESSSESPENICIPGLHKQLIKFQATHAAQEQRCCFVWIDASGK